MKGRKGTSLIEVTAATLISAMVTMAVFSVVLSTTVSTKKSDKKETAAMAIRMVQERLRAYVTVETSNAFLINRPGDTPFHLQGDANTGWALAAGDHNLDSWLTNPNFVSLTGGTLRYTVTNSDCSGLGGTDLLSCKTVVFTLTYPD